MLLSQLICPLWTVIAPRAGPQEVVSCLHGLQQHKMGMSFEVSINDMLHSACIFHLVATARLHATETKICELTSTVTVGKHLYEVVGFICRQDEFLPHIFLMSDLTVDHRLIGDSRKMRPKEARVRHQGPCVSSMELSPCFLHQNGPNFLSLGPNKRGSPCTILFKARNEIVDDDRRPNSVDEKVDNVDASLVYLFRGEKHLNRLLLVCDRFQHSEDVVSALRAYIKTVNFKLSRLHNLPWV